jgi:hypothetical protein
MTPDQIERLAALGTALRPDWPQASLRTFIADNLHWRAYGDIAVALAWVAAKEVGTETPKLLLRDGLWWKACNVDGHTTRHPPKAHEECPEHPGEYQLSCRLHAAERKAHRDELDQQAEERARLSRVEALAAMRDQVGDAQTAQREKATT